jgi:hypothetical protein
MAAHFVLAEPETAAQLAKGVAAALDRRIGNYWGPAGRAGAPSAAQRCGWKDPRNTFTLPVWREIYPELKIIHLMRHGVDVAASLARRQSEALHAATGEAVPGALTVIRDDAIGVLSTRRGWTLSEALTMWEEYVEKAREQASQLGHRALEIRFENLLEQPAAVIAEIMQFCELTDSAPDADWLGRLDARRCYAYRQEPRLVEFAQSQQSVLERYAYAP